MSVSFAEDLVEIKEYVLTTEERNDKKRALKRVTVQKKNKTTVLIRNILYRNIPTEQEYIINKLKSNYGEGGIYYIKGCNNTILDCDFETLYVNGPDRLKIRYNIFLNKYNKMVAKVSVSGFGGRTLYVQYFDSGIFREMFRAEYKAKMFILETTRKLFNEKSIM